MIKYCDIFWSFFKIGTFTIGGGYAMIPLMEQEIVSKHSWLSEEEFLDQVALSQSLPGVLAVNMATGVGCRLKGTKGSVIAVMGTIMMPIFFIIILAMVYRLFKENSLVEHFFMGVRPAAVALIAAPVFKLAQSAKISWKNCWIPIIAAVLIWLFDVNPILVILVAVVFGLLWSKLGKSVVSDKSVDNISEQKK